VQEFNSVEAIKNAVQHGLGAAFLSASAVEKELQLGLLAGVDIQGVTLARTLWLVTSPERGLSLVSSGLASRLWPAAVAACGLPQTQNPKPSRLWPAAVAARGSP
jgi:DNA-binding transcriptional LysR family regulator